MRHWSTVSHFVSSPPAVPARVPAGPMLREVCVVCLVLHVCTLCLVALAGPLSTAHLPTTYLDTRTASTTTSHHRSPSCQSACSEPSCRVLGARLQLVCSALEWRTDMALLSVQHERSLSWPVSQCGQCVCVACLSHSLLGQQAWVVTAHWIL